MEDYSSNSHRTKMNKENQTVTQEKKKVEKVITGTAKVKKKNELQKITDIFISEDVHDVKSYIVMDILIPAIKKAVWDVITNGLDMAMFGKNGRPKSGNSDRVSYNRSYSDNKRDYDRDRGRTKYQYDDIVLETRGEAESVLSKMDEILDMYGIVSVADLYEMAGIRDENYTNNNYGWTSLRNADYVRVRDGYLLKLPKPLPIK